MILVFCTPNSNHDQLLVNKPPTNQQTRSCHIEVTFDTHPVVANAEDGVLIVVLTVTTIKKGCLLLYCCYSIDCLLLFPFWFDGNIWTITTQKTTRHDCLLFVVGHNSSCKNNGHHCCFCYDQQQTILLRDVTVSRLLVCWWFVNH